MLYRAIISPLAGWQNIAARGNIFEFSRARQIDRRGSRNAGITKKFEFNIGGCYAGSPSYWVSKRDSQFEPTRASGHAQDMPLWLTNFAPQLCNSITDGRFAKSDDGVRVTRWRFESRYNFLFNFSLLSSLSLSLYVCVCVCDFMTFELWICLGETELKALRYRVFRLQIKLSIFKEQKSTVDYSIETAETLNTVDYFSSGNNTFFHRETINRITFRTCSTLD